MEPKFTWSLINDNISEDDKKSLGEFILTTNRFTNGPVVREFEQQWSDWLDVGYSTMVNSGASANYVSIAIVKDILGEGEVIVSPIGWVSDVASITNLGMTPVFVDVDMSNMSVTAKNIEAAITEKTKAVVLIHVLGFNAMSQEILDLRKKYGFMLIEDCCESHGATFDDKKVGTFGDISVFSYYYGHHMTTIEGGMVCTNSRYFYNRAKLFRSHGMTREASPETHDYYKEHYPHLNPLFTFAVPGFNVRSTEINAELGTIQLPKLDSVCKKRSDNLFRWLYKLDGDKFVTDFDARGNSNFALPLILKEGGTLEHRNRFKHVTDILDKEKIEYRIGTAGGGNQALQPYLEKCEHRIVGELTNTTHIHLYGLYIGNHTEVTFDMIDGLTSKLNTI